MFGRSAAPAVIAACICIVGAGNGLAQVELHELKTGVKGDQFGLAVAGAGDVDGDGAADVIVGSPESHFLSGEDSGKGHARVYSGATGDLLHEFAGDHKDDRFGASVAGGTDLDGDGRADLFVGADQVSQELFSFEGGYARAFSGAAGTVLFDFASPGMFGAYGRAVAFAGDVDADGAVDLLIGAPSLNAQAGAIEVRSGADGSVLLTVHGDPSDYTGLFTVIGDGLGECVAAAGDLDSDGHADFLGGTRSAWIFSTATGNRIYAFSGASGDRLYTFVGDGKLDGLGMSVAGAGDLDADGTPDVLGGAPFDLAPGSLFAGSARAFSGADGTGLYFLTGEISKQGFGGSVAGLGDVDADGHADFAVADGGHKGSGGSAGGLRLYGGAGGLPFAALEFDGEKFGVTVKVAAAGDADSDGTPDVAVGLRRMKNKGDCKLYSLGPAIGTAMASSCFVPGDSLEGAIASGNDVDEVRFLALGGSSLELTFSGDSGFAPKFSLHRVKGKKAGKAVADGQPDPLTSTLTLSIKKPGAYALRIRGANGTAGAYHVDTALTLPLAASAASLVAKAKSKQDGNWTATAKLLALAGSRLDATIAGPPGTTPELTLRTPSGDKVTKSLYSVALAGSTLTVTGAPLLETGTYELRIAGGAKDDEFAVTLAPSPPPSGSLIGAD